MPTFQQVRRLAPPSLLTAFNQNLQTFLGVGPQLQDDTLLFQTPPDIDQEPVQEPAVPPFEFGEDIQSHDIFQDAIEQSFKPEEPEPHNLRKDETFK